MQVMRMNNRFKPKYYYTFKNYFMFLMIYSMGGWVLERVLNLVFLGEWYDNRVLIGPYQPLYGSGVVLTIIFFNIVYTKLITWKPIYKELLLVFAAILYTGLVEAITGWGFQYLYGIHLWDYSEFFPCSLEYVCIIPTSLFGVISYIVVKYIHPIVHLEIRRINDYLFYSIFIIFIVDIVITLFTM